MKRILTRLTTTMAAVLCLIAACSPMANAASEVRFQLVREALILVPVTANEEGPFYFLLDTGADTTVVDSGLAKKLSLATTQSVRQETVTGSHTLNVSELAKLAVGGVQMEGLRVLEQDLSGLRQVDARIMGIVGQDFLSRFNYLVDYRRKLLRIEEGGDLREMLEGEVVPVEMGGHRMIVAAEVQSKGSAKLRLLLDSGANALVLTGRASTALHCPILQPQVEKSSAGTTVLRTGRVDLMVAAHAFRDVTVVLVEKAQEGVGDGLLPMSLFDGVYVNNAQGYVVVNPRVKKTVQVAMAGRAQ